MAVDFRELCKLQIVEIDRQRAEIGQLQAENRRLIGWIMGEEPSAHLALQKIYSDPKTSVPDVIKSASAALRVEHPTGSAVVVKVDFKQQMHDGRMRQLEKDRARWALEDQSKTIEGTVLGSDHEGQPAIGPEADPAA
jgi:hypothetical protein